MANADTSSTLHTAYSGALTPDFLDELLRRATGTLRTPETDTDFNYIEGVVRIFTASGTSTHLIALFSLLLASEEEYRKHVRATLPDPSFFDAEWEPYLLEQTRMVLLSFGDDTERVLEVYAHSLRESWNAQRIEKINLPN